MNKSFPKTLLVNPPQKTKYPQPSLGLAMVAAVLEQNGYKVKILDLPALGSSEDLLIQIIAQEKPDIVGITSSTPLIKSAMKVARKVKVTDKNILVVLGGPHGSLLPEETLQSMPEIDIVVRGEGEHTMLQLVKFLDGNPKTSLQNILGITYRSSQDIKSNAPRSHISNLDELPFPAFHLLPIEKYRLHPPFGRKSHAMPIITSRGCPYRCIFCSKSIFRKQYQCNSPGYVANEIEFLHQKFGINEIKFYDDVFTLNKRRTIAFCNELRERRLDIPWTCETRVNLVNDDLLMTMKDAGCYMIEYGVESGNQVILNSLKKDIQLQQVIDAFESTKKAGIDTVAYFMVGAPGETQNTIKDSIDFAKKLDPDFVQFSIATPYPGTEFYELFAKNGEISSDWEKYVYDDINSSDYPVFSTSSLGKEDLKEASRKAYYSFYLRWRYVLKRMYKMKSIGELKTNLIGLRKLLAASG